MTDLTAEELRLAALAAHVDLSSVEDRRRSNHELVQFFHGVIGAVGPGAVLEIGAFEAAFSREVRRRNPSVRSVAFEANPYNFEHFSKGIDYAAAGVDYRHLAISDRDGTAEFMIQARRGGQEAPRIKGDDSLIARAQEGVEYERVRVPAAALDSVLEREGLGEATLALWIDVEGAAERVFSGATKALGRTRAVFIEVEERAYWEGQWLFSDVHRALASRGFRAVGRDFENAQQFNVLFVDQSTADHWLFRAHFLEYITRLGARRVG